MIQQNKIGYRYLVPLSMLYMTIKLTTLLLIYKVISIGTFSASASTLIMPFWFVLGDIIAEVYGYKIARKLIWMAIIYQFLFAFVCAEMISLHTTSPSPHQEAYNHILGKLPRIAFSSFIAILAGAFINAYVISKWKILLCGKYFWLRSLGASSIGELIFTGVAYISEFLGVVPLASLLELMIASYVIKLILNPILVIPSTLVVYLLKRAENLDTYDYGVNFNPFKLTSEENHENYKTLYP